MLQSVIVRQGLDTATCLFESESDLQVALREGEAKTGIKLREIRNGYTAWEVTRTVWDAMVKHGILEFWDSEDYGPSDWKATGKEPHLRFLLHDYLGLFQFLCHLGGATAIEVYPKEIEI